MPLRSRNSKKTRLRTEVLGIGHRRRGKEKKEEMLVRVQKNFPRVIVGWVCAAWRECVERVVAL